MRFRCFFDKSSVSPLGDFSLIITPKLPNSSTISAFGGKIPLTYRKFAQTERKKLAFCSGVAKFS